MDWVKLHTHWMCKIKSDGAFKASNAMAAARGLLRDDQGQWRISFIANIGSGSFMTFELWGALLDLRLA